MCDLLTEIDEIGFILLAMISLSLFYVIKHYLEHQPAIQEKMIRGLLIPLAIADVSVFGDLSQLKLSVAKANRADDRFPLTDITVSNDLLAANFLPPAIRY